MQLSMPTSRKWLLYCGAAFCILLALLVLQKFAFGDVIVDVRMGGNGPEMLFRGDFDLWVPTSLAQYWWFQAKPLILIPFGVLALAIGYWHKWEERQAQSEY